VFARQGAVAPPWLSGVGAAFAGAALALLFGAVRGRWANGATARRLALALFEELSAVGFAPGPPTPMFAGFSSQVFDSLFADLARCLPEDLFRAIVRYHWKMKFILEWVSKQRAALGPAAAGVALWVGVSTHVLQAEQQWSALRPRLETYSRRALPRLFITRRERLLGHG